jgi:DNA/RNA endonuclease G (NUC1)
MLRSLSLFAGGSAVGGSTAYLLLRRREGPSSEDSPPRATPPPQEPDEWRRTCTYGLPVSSHLHVGSGYVSATSFRERIPHWVVEHLRKGEPDGKDVDRKHSKFRPDPMIPEAFRADNDDYFRSNLSRGHMAPAGAHKHSQAELDDTFVLSANILPQELSNNGSDWLRLERFTTELLKTHSDVHVISGPLFLPQPPPEAAAAVPAAAAAAAASDAPPARVPIRKHVGYDVIGRHEVAVPTHLFKVVLAENVRADGKTERRLSAFVLPNGPLHGHPPLDSFVVPLEEVERASGLLLFPELEGRAHIPPLCGDGGEGRPSCGLGAMDGRIQGWKLLGHLKCPRPACPRPRARATLSAPDRRRSSVRTG